jgi:ribosome biogenesis GTPase A
VLSRVTVEEVDNGDDVFGEVPPYEPTQEHMPEHAIYSPQFQEAKQIAIAIFDPFRATIEVSDYRDPVIDALLEKINNCRDFERRADVTVGLSGDSGVGKSSLLNSILSEAGIAVLVSLSSH